MGVVWVLLERRERVGVLADMWALVSRGGDVVGVLRENARRIRAVARMYVLRPHNVSGVDVLVYFLARSYGVVFDEDFEDFVKDRLRILYGNKKIEFNKRDLKVFTRLVGDEVPDWFVEKIIDELSGFSFADFVKAHPKFIAKKLARSVMAGYETLKSNSVVLRDLDMLKRYLEALRFLSNEEAVTVLSRLTYMGAIRLANGLKREKEKGGKEVLLEWASGFLESVKPYMFHYRASPVLPGLARMYELGLNEALDMLYEFVEYALGSGLVDGDIMYFIGFLAMRGYQRARDLCRQAVGDGERILYFPVYAPKQYLSLFSTKSKVGKKVFPRIDMKYLVDLEFVDKFSGGVLEARVVRLKGNHKRIFLIKPSPEGYTIYRSGWSYRGILTRYLGQRKFERLFDEKRYTEKISYFY